MKKKFLEKIFTRLLREAGQEPPENIPIPLKNKLVPGEELSKKIVSRLQSAKSAKLALCRIIDVPREKFFILYKAAETINHFTSFASSKTKVGPSEIEKELKDMSSEVVIGMIQLSDTESKDGPCNNAYVVNMSATRDGYGPLLYDIAMSLSGGRPIISDRKAVSTLAATLYKGFLRRGDIEKTRLVDKNDPQNVGDPKSCTLWSDTWPDRDFLDYSYKRSSSIDAGELEQNHVAVVEGLKSILSKVLPVRFSFDYDNRIKYWFGEAGYDYFSIVYTNLTDKQKAWKSQYSTTGVDYKFRESVNRRRRRI